MQQVTDINYWLELKARHNNPRISTEELYRRRGWDAKCRFQQSDKFKTYDRVHCVYVLGVEGIGPEGEDQ